MNQRHPAFPGSQQQTDIVDSVRRFWVDPRYHRFVHGVLLVLLLAITLIPRLTALDRLATPDEPLWLGRSANFYQALSSGHLADTYQYVHPGVMVMWAGTIGYLWKYPNYADDAETQIEVRGSALPDILTAHDHTPLEMLVALRKVLIIFSTIIFGLAFLYGLQLFGRPIAIIGFLLIALDPFHVALTRILHLDGLSTNLLLLTLLSFLFYVDQRKRRDLIVSGVAVGFAWLTRSADLIMGPIFVLLIFVELLPQRHNRSLLLSELRSWVKLGIAWTAIGVATFIIFWPAMWVSPIDTLRKMVQGSLDLATEPHARQIFFADKLFIDDPGASFYPVIFVWRSTPIVLLGLIFAIVILLRPHTFGAHISKLRLIQLAIFAFFYLLVLTMGAKKLDRYELPSQVVFNLIAAMGWVAFGQWLIDLLRQTSVRQLQRSAQVIAVAVLALAIGIQAGLTASSAPYYFNYFNPLLGGAIGARSAVMVGWGEGMDVAAIRLEQQIPDLDQLTIMSGPWPTALSYFLNARRVLRPDFDAPTSSDAIRLWVVSDFRVVSFPEIQRQLIPPEMLDYYQSLSPLFVTQLNGEDYVWVYDLRHAPLPDYFVNSDQPMFDWGATLRQVASSLPTQPVTVGEEARIVLYLQALTPLNQPLIVDVQLLDSTGKIVSHEEKSVNKPTQDRTVWPRVFTVPVPSQTPPGTYRVAMVVRDKTTQQPLSVVTTKDGIEVTGPAVIGTIAIAAAPSES